MLFVNLKRKRFALWQTSRQACRSGQKLPVGRLCMCFSPPPGGRGNSLLMRSSPPTDQRRPYPVTEITFPSSLIVTCKRRNRVSEKLYPPNCPDLVDLLFLERPTSRTCRPVTGATGDAEAHPARKRKIARRHRAPVAKRSPDEIYGDIHSERFVLAMLFHHRTATA